MSTNLGEEVEDEGVLLGAGAPHYVHLCEGLLRTIN